MASEFYLSSSARRLDTKVTPDVNNIFNTAGYPARQVTGSSGNIAVDLWNGATGAKDKKLNEIEQTVLKPLEAKLKTEPNNKALAANIHNLKAGIQIARSSSNLTEAKNKLVKAYNGGQLRDGQNRKSGLEYNNKNQAVGTLQIKEVNVPGKNNNQINGVSMTGDILHNGNPDKQPTPPGVMKVNPPNVRGGQVRF
jgi:hypothetical protein